MADKRKSIVLRFGIVYFFILFLFALVVYRIVVLQFVEKDKWLEVAEKNKKTDIRVKPNRGNIFASDGRLMASTIPTYYIYMDTRVPALHKDDGKLFKENVDSLALSLSKYFGDRSKDQYKLMLKKAYREGKGSVTIRGIIEKEEDGTTTKLIITEIPYQVIKSELVSKIAQLIKDKTIEGINKIRDESNKKGIRVVLELKRDACSDTIINLLFKHTQLQINIHIALLAISNNKPKLFTLKSALQEFINHRKIVLTKRTLYDKAKAEYQEHILAGIAKIINDTERVNKLLNEARSREEASDILKKEYLFSNEQARAVLDLRLYQLNAMERSKITS